RGRATEDIASGEYEHSENERVPLANPERQRESGEHSVEYADPIGDGNPGHVVLVCLDAEADGVVGDDRLNESLIRRKEDKEDCERGEPVPAPEQHRGLGRRAGDQVRRWGGKRCHGVAVAVAPALSSRAGSSGVADALYRVSSSCIARAA